MSQRPATIADILDLLGHHPEGMTRAELASELGVHRGAVTSSINYERRMRGSERLRVAGYVPTRGHGGQDQPMFALGPGRDAKRPTKSTKQRRLESRARYRAANAARLSVEMQVRRAPSSTEFNPFAQMVRALKVKT